MGLGPTQFERKGKIMNRSNTSKTIGTMVILFLILGVCTSGAMAKWQPLFDGKILDGWEVKGGVAKYHVEDGAIVGSTVKGSPNTFLCTKKEYSDFILEFEVLCDPALNSGCQIRSHVYEKDTTLTIERNGRKVEQKRRKGEVYGYQVEIANVSTGSSGGVWDEARQAKWLYATKPDPQAAKALKNNEWNHYRIQCIGDHIRTWVNGIACADFHDPLDASGLIGLQVHSIRGDQTLQVRWRNVRIRDLSGTAWQPNFKTNQLNDWIVKGNKNKWVVGAAQMNPDSPKQLIAKTGAYEMANLAVNHGDSSDIYSKSKFGDCYIALEVMVPKGSNSGIYVMGEYEIQVLDSYGKDPKRFGPGDMGAIYGAAVPKIDVNPCSPPGQWQQYVIEFRAPRFDDKDKKIENAKFLKVELNGKTLHQNLEMPKQTPGGVVGREAPVGPLMFQGNHGPVAYRNIRIYPMNYN
jgi:3-keto-disaccharide hydrolase